MNESGEIVGMVDVLKLTYATLEQVSDSSRINALYMLTPFQDQHDADS